MQGVPKTVPRACIPFLARAKELQTRDPVIAYWCRFNAAQIALEHTSPNDNEAREYLGNLLGELEDSKAALADNELVTDDAAGSAYIYNFASKVFEVADATDRSGKATRATAREFLAASIFFDLLSIFGPLETDAADLSRLYAYLCPWPDLCKIQVSEKAKYAKWKATSISKAFKEGRAPTPGPAGGLGPDSSQQANPSGPSADQQTAPDGEAEAEEPSLPSIPDHAPSSSSSAPFSSTSALDHRPSAPSFDNEDTEDVSNFSLPPPPSSSSSSSAFPSNFNNISSEDHPSLPSVPSSFAPRGGEPSAPLPPVIRANFSNTPPPPTPKPNHPPLPAPTPASTSASAAIPPPAVTPAGTSANPSSQWQPAPAQIDTTAIANAQKYAKWAISALNYEDIETAQKELRKALALIGG